MDTVLPVTGIAPPVFSQILFVSCTVEDSAVSSAAIGNAKTSSTIASGTCTAWLMPPWLTSKRTKAHPSPWWQHGVCA